MRTIRPVAKLDRSFPHRLLQVIPALCSRDRSAGVYGTALVTPTAQCHLTDEPAGWTSACAPPAIRFDLHSPRKVQRSLKERDDSSKPDPCVDRLCVDVRITARLPRGTERGGPGGQRSPA